MSLSTQFDRAPSSRRRARALAAARLLGDSDTFTFFKEFAKLSGFKNVQKDDYLGHFIWFVRSWEDYVIDEGPLQHIKAAGVKYHGFHRDRVLGRVWLWLADCYLRAAHPGGHDELLGSELDHQLFGRMVRFGESFAIDTQILAQVRANLAQLHVLAKESLKSMKRVQNPGQTMQLLYNSTWYRIDPDARLAQADVHRFVVMHLPNHVKSAFALSSVR
ncbi:MAG TPA: hypothetical protein VD907_01790 [Verrucomicrobiae bacterium]|nr:hypothetical protein [Verrucomicrobiae bacterium]